MPGNIGEVNYWKNRDGNTMETLEALAGGPMAMVTNGYAGSGGDLAPISIQPGFSNFA